MKKIIEELTECQRRIEEIKEDMSVMEDALIGKTVWYDGKLAEVLFLNLDGDSVTLTYQGVFHSNEAEITLAELLDLEEAKE